MINCDYKGGWHPQCPLNTFLEKGKLEDRLYSYSRELIGKEKKGTQAVIVYLILSLELFLKPSLVCS
jgi:hypothetical protein